MNNVKKNCSRVVAAIVVVVIMLSTLLLLTGCEYTTFTGDSWKKKYDISAPNLAEAGDSLDAANSSGWYSTMLEEFDSDSYKNLWQPVGNTLRREEYWCDKMISLNEGKVEIKAEQSDTHECENCGDKSNLYTSGIITARNENGKRVPTFSQAYGYFEAKVQFPNSGGMWSAFWLQTNSQGQIGNGGKDGAEIDIYESSFWSKRDYVGQCIHYDGYGKEHKGGQSMNSVGYDLYKGYHTFAVKWTPNEYVFYVDNVAVWATDFGGICTVPAYLMLTNEVRIKAATGPYGQVLGDFTGGTFYIESVSVYQNSSYLSHVKSASDYK